MKPVALIIFPIILLALPADAASVKRNNSAEGRSEFHISPNGVTISNYRLQFLIPNAFHIAVYQMAGAPPWMDINKYDIVARAPEGASEDQIRPMLQQLLAERFGLRFHREHRDLPAYALVLAKDGPKFKTEKRDIQPEDNRAGAGRGMARGHMIPASTLAETLSLYLGRPVIDKSGIEGLFNFELRWTPDETQPQLGGASTATPPVDVAGPSLLAAIQEQLGLKLIAQRTSVDMFVIDRLWEVPTGN